MINCEDVLIDKLKDVISNSKKPIKVDLSNTYTIYTDNGYILIVKDDCIKIFENKKIKLNSIQYEHLVDKIDYSYTVQCITEFVQEQYEQQLQQEKEKSIQKHLKHLNSIL